MWESATSPPISSGAGRTEASYLLPSRSTLLLYTDGLVERRGRAITDGIAAAGAAVREAGPDSLEDLAEQVMTGLAPAGGYEDDVALVLGRVRARSVEQNNGDEPVEPLSSRELDVLRLIARGLENAEIAEALSISPRTAKNHVSNILSKLGLPGRVQAAIYAVRRGLD